MFTLRTWNALRTPPQHPLDLHLQATIESQKSPGEILSSIINRNIVFEFLALAVVLGTCLTSCLVFGFFAGIILITVPMIIPFIGTIFGLNCAMKISNGLTREYRARRYDLLATSPVGRVGVHWYISSAVCRSSSSLNQTVNVARPIYALTLIGIAAMILLPSLMNLNDAPLHTLINNLLSAFPVLVILALIYWDFTQSIVLSSILGMLIPTYVHDEIEAGSMVLGVFLLAQIIFYAVVGIIAFGRTSWFTAIANISGWFVSGGMFLLLWFCVREIAIWQTARFLTQRLDADSGRLHMK